MSKHTPGPWIAASHASSVVGWPIVGRHGRSIASVHWLPKKPAEMSDDEWQRYSAECEANAHLIGAAPELLAMLGEVASGMDEAVRILDLMGRGFDARNLQIYANNARAVIRMVEEFA